MRISTVVLFVIQVTIVPSFATLQRYLNPSHWLITLQSNLSKIICTTVIRV